MRQLSAPPAHVHTHMCTCAYAKHAFTHILQVYMKQKESTLELAGIFVQRLKVMLKPVSPFLNFFKKKKKKLKVFLHLSFYLIMIPIYVIEPVINSNFLNHIAFQLVLYTHGIKVQTLSQILNYICNVQVAFPCIQK